MSIQEEYHCKYRPKSFKQVVGQEMAVNVLKSMKGKYPHAICFHGPSGTGKTTMARIVKDALGCGDSDYKEINAASARGVDTIREIEGKMRLAPLSGKCRVFCLDEAHRLTSDAQSALLKMLEDPPSSAYFILATTDPQKLLPTIRTRCTEIPVKTVDEDDLRSLIERIITKERLDVSEDVVDKLIEVADGSPRRAVVALNRIVGLKSDDDRLNAIELADERKQAIDVCRYLMGFTKGCAITSWGDMAEVLKEVPDSEIERFRRMVLGYATACMLGAKGKKPPQKPNQRAYAVMVAFADNFFDSGRAGLVSACCEVIFGD